nr:hypothetical protein [Tanacetum cinerariifolium]
MVFKIIDDELFDRLHDDDVVSLCCLGILQLILLGVEGKRRIPDWMLRLANDRVGWDNYLWGLYVWPTLYSQLKNANVGRWSKLYATQPSTEIDKKSYSIFGYTWAFKTWILESFRVTTTGYYNRYNRYRRVAAWKKEKFMGTMVHGFFHRNLSGARLTPDETEARSDCSFFNIGTPTHWQTPRSSQPGSSNWQTQISSQHGPSNWQSQMPAQLPTPFWQPVIPSHVGTYNWQSPIPSHMGNSNLQPPIGRHHDAIGLFNLNILIQGKREQRPSFYKQSPYMEQPPSTVLPKKRDDDNEGGDDVIFFGGQFTVPVTFWQQLVPHLCMPDFDSNTPVGRLSGEHMNSWMELLIRNRPNNAPWTVAYTNTISVHPKSQRFFIETDQHAIGILDGSTRLYLAWNDVNWVFMPIHIRGNHWVTGVIDLPNSHIYVFGSLPNEGRKNLLWNLIERWTPVVNNILQGRGCFNATRGPYYFQFSYNHGLGIDVPQQFNFSDCGVITCWLISCLCSDRKPIVTGK